MQFTNFLKVTAWHMDDFLTYFQLDPMAVQNAIKILVSAIVGSLIGLERVLAGKDPGLRTFMLVCLGSCVFSILSESLGASVGSEPSRIAAQIVPGIGFLGAGAIFRARDRIAGLTTAALMWLTASVGMAIGFGHIMMALTTLFVTMLMMYLLTKVHQLLKKYRPEVYKNRIDF